MWKEWVKIVTSESKEYISRFPALHKFLLQWRDRLEYGLAEIRSSTVKHGNVHFGETKNGKSTPSCWLHPVNCNRPFYG